MKYRSPWKKPKATHASIEGGIGVGCAGYRATVFAGKRVIASSYFGIPKENAFKGFSEACDKAYSEAKKWLAGFGVS